MKLRLLIMMSALVVSFVGRVVTAADDKAEHPPKLYSITSWGDIVAIYGPGTDPAMDTPEAIENMILHWKARGYSGVFMRTDLGQIEPFIRRNPVIANTQASQGGGNSDPRQAPLYRYIDRVMDAFDYHAVGQQLSEKYQFEWWAWHPHLYSDGAPEWAGGPGHGRIWPWMYVDKYTFEHPEIVTIDRDGNPYWMVREFAYPGARESKIAEFVHMARTLGVKRFISCMRSESSQVQEAPDKADRYGFNAPIVTEMKRRYDVDILSHPRFDVDNPDFNPRDPMVQAWHELRGSYVTQFYRELRKALRDVDPEIRLAVTLSGEHVGPPLGNWRLDWRSWVDEGLVDMIITPVFFEATLDHDATKKGYLTHAREGVGVVPYQEMRQYIAQSKHPEIQVIATDGPPYLFTAPPEGTDGWRIDAWYNAYHLAWYQRWWTQCVKDVEMLGHIQFIRQNFDKFPVGSAGHAGGWGDSRYDPALRACPGLWYTLGDGSCAKPAATKERARGGSGLAIRLTASEHSPASLRAIHRSFPDRSGIHAGVDNAITNGTALFEFWIYRDAASSGLSAFLQDTGVERDVGLRIAPESGRVSYAVVQELDSPAWLEAEWSVPLGKWQRMAIEVDLDRGVYHGFAGEADQTNQLWRDVPLGEPKQRIIEHPNEHLPIHVPSHKMFRQIEFIPEGKDGSVVHIDDVALNWTPTLHYTKPRPKVLFHDDFERHTPDASINNVRTSRGGMWLITSDAGASAFSITNDTSFGDGVNALIVTSGGTAVARGEPLRHIQNSYITVDLDVYVRSDRDYPYMMPDPTTTSRHRMIAGIRRKGTNENAATALVSDGTWWIWDGSRYADTGIRVAYDVWNHLQIAVDATTGQYRVVAQPVGEMPTLVGTAQLGEAIVINSDLEFFIQTSDTENHLSLYDNVLVTAGSRP